MFIHILNRVISNLFSWKAMGTCNLDRDIRTTEVAIQALEIDNSANPLDDTDHSNLNILYNKHRALLRQNEKKWAQRAKINWIHNGDMNTSFFAKSTRIRQHSNFISHVEDYQTNLCRPLYESLAGSL